jgi:hypothetical protein
METMNRKKKELCKWGKDSFEKNLDDLAELTSAPRFACKSCGRVANAKKNLCKPLKFPPAKKAGKSLP